MFHPRLAPWVLKQEGWRVEFQEKQGQAAAVEERSEDATTAATAETTPAAEAAVPTAPFPPLEYKG